jgi:C-terminal processing protease CtpA/Prc
MASFLDKAKEKASQLAAQAKDKVDDHQARSKADDLLDDIGRIIYRQRTTGATEPGDEAALDALVAELKALADAGTDFMEPESAAAAAPASTLPPPTPPADSPAPTPAVAPPAAAPMPMPMPEPGNG